MLKTSSIATLALALSVSGAWADGVSLKDAPAAFGWGGMYLGGTVGYGWGGSEAWYNNDGRQYTSGDKDHPNSENNPSGILGGITVGYNHPLSNKWVAGVEGDLSMADLKGDDGKCLWDNYNPNNCHSWYTGWGSLFTLRARVGYDMNGTLLYGTLGYAAVHSSEYILGNNANESSDNTGWRGGWAIGFGAERMFTDRISGKVEYLHVEMSDKTGTSLQGFPYGFSNDLDVIRLGLNYKIK